VDCHIAIVSIQPTGFVCVTMCTRVSGRPTAGQLRCGPLSIAMARHFQLVVEREVCELLITGEYCAAG